VGKSSIANALIGDEVLRTREVRESDSRGRHTTTGRQLVLLPGGGILIDTPGMRELQLWDAGESVAGAFADVESIGEGCRFRDCRHAGEPGCAVAAAVAAGMLPTARLESYRKLQDEQAHQATQQDERARLELKRQGKIGAKALRKRIREKDR
jgi:ribosome biogenesis GTPase